MITQTWGPKGLWLQYAPGSGPAPKVWVNEPSVFRKDGKATTTYQRTLKASGVSLSAQASADGKTVFVRVVNNGALPSNVTITLAGGTIAPTGTSWTLAPPSTSVTSNSPTNVNAVSPVQASVAYAPGATYTVPGASTLLFLVKFPSNPSSLPALRPRIVSSYLSCF